MATKETPPKNFHIHIDAQVMPPSLEIEVKKRFGFYDHHFTGHPAGYKHFEPNYHLTRKIVGNGREFRSIWLEVENTMCGSGFVGYLEGEYISRDIALSQKPYDEQVRFPFAIEKRRLGDNEIFRETEFHLVLDGDKSDPRLITKLLDSGLYGAYLDKRSYRALVLTMQGYRGDITSLMDSTIEYLDRAGGVVRGTIKEERAIRHRLFGITPVDLPEIADKITYFL